MTFKHRWGKRDGNHAQERERQEGGREDGGQEGRAPWFPNETVQTFHRKKAGRYGAKAPEGQKEGRGRQEHGETEKYRRFQEGCQAQTRRCFQEGDQEQTHRRCQKDNEAQACRRHQGRREEEDSVEEARRDAQEEDFRAQEDKQGKNHPYQGDICGKAPKTQL
ncbi:MAG: hypothetical protein ACYTAN_13300 [Planctomycetota bacterium]